MYCPRCSHHAGPDNNVRFCPGCGLWLQGVSELVANDGHFARSAETEPKPRRSMVKRGALLGATLMFIPLLMILPVIRHGPWERGPRAFFFIWLALMALIGVSGYLKRLFTKFFSEEEAPPSKNIAYILPATYIAPVVDTGRQFVDAVNAARPASVTEQTTSRLNNV